MGADDWIVSYLIITRNRADDLSETLRNVDRQRWPRKEIVVVDNCSEDGTEEVVTRFSGKCESDCVYFRADENLGVSGGRNEAYRLARGDILVTIDDDAVFTGDDATEVICETFRARREVGILAFRIVDYHTGALIRDQFPTRRKSRNPNVEFFTGWFIGAGHAVRKEVFDRAGPYNDFWPYGSEELDVSYRTLDLGYRILFTPAVEVRHKVTPAGRITAGTPLNTLLLTHRLKVAALNLPWRYVFTHWLFWGLAYLVLLAPGNVRVVFGAFRTAHREWKSWMAVRGCIGEEAVAELAAVGGQLWR